MADGPKRSNRGLANEGVVMGLSKPSELTGDSGIMRSLATRPCSLLNDASVAVVEQGSHWWSAARGC